MTPALRSEVRCAPRKGAGSAVKVPMVARKVARPGVWVGMAAGLVRGVGWLGGGAGLFWGEPGCGRVGDQGLVEAGSGHSPEVARLTASDP